MSEMDERSLAAFALTTRLLDIDVDPLTARSFWPLLAAVPNLETLLGLSEAEVGQRVIATDINPASLVRLLDRGLGLANQLTGLHDRGIEVVAGCDERYPGRLKDRLGSAAPPLLYLSGDVSLFDVDGIGVVGSRDVSPEGREVAEQAARWAVGERMVLVSGGARGVDQVSMGAAFEAGGNVVGVLADSLEKTLSQAENRQAVLGGNALLCTPYNPDSGFSVGAAMGRNKIIYALSYTTLVVATDEGSGGTWAGATEAIRRGFGSVTVWNGPGAGPGNAALIEAGGHPISDIEKLADSEPVQPVVNEQTALRFGEEPPDR